MHCDTDIIFSTQTRIHEWMAWLKTICLPILPNMPHPISSLPPNPKTGRRLEDQLAQADKYLSASVRCLGGRVAHSGGLGQEGQSWKNLTNPWKSPLLGHSNLHIGHDCELKVLHSCQKTWAA